MKTESENLFEQYLNGLGYKYEYEPDLGVPEKPDYLVKTLKGDIICEVKEFDKGYLEKAVDSRKIKTWASDPYKRIRKKIDSARKKFKNFKDKGYPCILILYNKDAIIDLAGFIIAGAMWGDLNWQVAIDPSGQNQPKDLGLYFGRDGKMSPKQNTVISAVAVISYFCPDQKLIDSLIDEEELKRGKKFNPQEYFSRAREIQKERGLEPDKKVLHLKIYKNPFSPYQLTEDIFNGQYDRYYILNIQKGVIFL